MLQRKRQKGFSLIEVMVALTVLSIGLVGTVKFQSVMLKNSGNTQARLEAVNIAQARIEAIGAYQNLAAYDELKSSATLIADAAALGVSLDFSQTGTNTAFTVDWVVTENVNPNHLEISVTVAWADVFGAPQSIKLDSIVGKIDPNFSGLLTL